MGKFTEEQYAKILKRQEAEWERALKFGKGNPYATLCMHCYGRHRPPYEEICPNDPPSKSTVTPCNPGGQS